MHKRIQGLDWCLAILGNNASFVFSFVAIFVSQERFLLWKMTPEHLTDCERNMSHNMSQEVLGSIGKYFHPSSFLNLHSSTFTQVIRYSSLSSRRFLFSNVKHEVKWVEKNEHSLTWEQWKYIVLVKQEALSYQHYPSRSISDSFQRYGVISDKRRKNGAEASTKSGNIIIVVIGVIKVK